MLYLLRYGEIFLKGQNRSFFEKALVKNIKQHLKGNKHNLVRLRNRLLLESETPAELKTIFGLISCSPCIKTDADVESIKQIVAQEIQRFHNKKFRVSANRLTKTMSLNSGELNKELGAFILQKAKAKVSLKEFDIELGIEIIGKDAYIFYETTACFGGLPVGVEGKVALLVDDKSSILAGLLMMKRGCAIVPFSHKRIGIVMLEKYGCRTKIMRVKNIRELTIAAVKVGCQALASGAILANFSRFDTSLPVLYPLIGFSGQEIEEKLALFAA